MPNIDGDDGAARAP